MTILRALKTLCLGCAILMAPIPVVGETPEARIQKTGTAIARLTMVRDVCSIDHVVDQLLVNQALLSTARDGATRFGPELIKAAIDKQARILSAEFKRDGSSIWCGKQRERYRRAGLDGMIGGPLP